MHGAVICGLRRFVVSEYGESTWNRVLEVAPVDDQLFVPVTDYPDEFYYGLADTAASVTARDRPAIDRGTGRGLADILRDGDDPTLPLPADGGAAVDCGEALDEREPLAFLAAAEEWGGTLASGDATPPVQTQFVEDGVELTYSCPRGLCRVVRGVLDGIVGSARGGFVVEETTCMHERGDECRFLVTPRTRPTSADHGGQSGSVESTD